MPKSEETPPIRVSKLLTVFHRYVDAVVRAVKISTSGRFRTRAVGKLRIKNQRQLFYENRSFGKLACLQIGIDVFLFYVYVMVFGEVRLGTASGLVAVILPIIEAVGRQGRPHKNPCAIAGRQLHLAIRIEHCSRLRTLSANGSRLWEKHGAGKQTNSNDYDYCY
jgi:hypothetical protein